MCVCPVFSSRGYGGQEVERRHPEEHGDGPGGGDAEPDRPSGQPRVHRGQHEQLRLRGQVSNSFLAILPPIGKV